MSRASRFAIALLLCACVLVMQHGSQAEDESPPRLPAANRASAAEERIERALAGPTEFAFVDSPLADVAEYFATKHDIEVQFDKRALAESGIDLDTPVTCSIRKPIALDSAVDLILEPLELTWDIQHEVLLITTQDRAAELISTRVYPFGDLVVERHQRSDDLIDIITSSVAPDSWDANGGHGSIAYFGGFIVVDQTRRHHREVADLLEQLRANCKQAAIASPHATDADRGEPQLIVELYRVSEVDGDELAATIQKHIAHESWIENGGKASIQVLHRAHSEKDNEKYTGHRTYLVIRQTEPALDEICQIFRPLLSHCSAPPIRQFGGFSGIILPSDRTPNEPSSDNK